MSKKLFKNVWFGLVGVRWSGASVSLLQGLSVLLSQACAGALYISLSVYYLVDVVNLQFNE